MASELSKTKQRAAKSLGLCCVYVKHSAGFYGTIRPCHDSAPDGKAELTDRQVSRLRSMMARYMNDCHAKNLELKAIKP